VGPDHTFLKPVFDNFPSGKPEAAVAGATLQLGELLPRQRGYYPFEGSLTIPPCSEHVRWLVLKSPVEASAAQLKQYAAHYPDDARPLQPLNGRLVEETRA
jgi:carbonic anhydrase